ncbi:hypothetical protein BU26DRAFT_520999 [Trematosphaeria pertusa]|uniref:Uncharacterized protein n=1 Tax=Trematosphaeria pertusa TaxID=390896 RepID=A0A6A6I868_9PLEO|nr:uncharacterized protein BU26DRAFT_520999 [Trematosphaeria pertusa]KAF2246546.1 hypothetical protein BU26DRAFT_520999 [Trematosphaeria pertusa]
MLQNGSGSNLTACEKAPSARVACDASLIKPPHGPAIPFGPSSANSPPALLNCSAPSGTLLALTLLRLRLRLLLAVAPPRRRQHRPHRRGRRPPLPSLCCRAPSIVLREQKALPAAPPISAPRNRPAFQLHHLRVLDRSRSTTPNSPARPARRRHVYSRDPCLRMQPPSGREGAVRDIEKCKLRRPQHQDGQARREM